MKKLSFAMTPKDLINIGVFFVLYFLTMSVNAAAVLGPVWIYLALVIAAPLGGIVFQLFLTRVKHAGMVLIFGLISGAMISMVHGWQTMLLTFVFSALAEVVLYLGEYRSRTAAFWTYPVFQLWSMGPILPILINAEAYQQMLLEVRHKSAEYASQVVDLSHNPIFIGAVVLGIIALSALGSWIGQKMLRKHFEKAGIA